MDFPDLSPLTKNMCRTCLAEVDTKLVDLKDYVAFELSHIRLTDMLLFLGCIDTLEDSNWPQGLCEACVSNACAAYNFKSHCEKSTQTLMKILTSAGSSSPNLPEIDPMDILSFIHQDHEYELPFFSNTESNIMQNLTITSLPIIEEENRDNERFTSGIDEDPEPIQEYYSKTPDPIHTKNESKEEQKIEKEKENQVPDATMQEVKEKFYPCPYCQSSFAKTYGLKYHMDKHKTPNSKLCQKCGKGFSTTGLLHQHQLTHKTAQHKCKICNKFYKTKQSIKVHYRVAHSSNRYSFACQECSMVFTAKASLVSHLNIHKGDRKLFSCTHCPKSYARKSNLRVHLQTHTVEGKVKRFICSHLGCDKRYATKHCLDLHILYSHLKNKPFICEVCSKTFVTKANLDCHKRVHKNSVCNICGLKFLNKKILKNHLKTHN